MDAIDIMFNEDATEFGSSNLDSLIEEIDLIGKLLIPKNDNYLITEGYVLLAVYEFYTNPDPRDKIREYLEKARLHYECIDI